MLVNNIMIRLRQKDIERLAIITDGSVDYLTKLVSMSLIDHSYAVDQLIKYSYKKLKSEKRYTPAQMIEALMREYGASKSKSSKRNLQQAVKRALLL